MGIVGRGRELGALRGWLEQAKAGSGRVVICGGEAGIGKTRLAQEFAGSTLASRYRRRLGALRRRRRRARVLALAAGVERSEGRRRRRTGAVSAGDRFRLFEAVTESIDDAAGSQGLVVLLDDIHRADEPSLLVLRYLADQVGTCRSSSSPPAATTSARHYWPSYPPTVSTCTAWTSTAVREQLPTATPEQVDHVFTVTGGNPLFVTEVARAIADGSWQPDRPPRTVLDIVSSRLDRVIPTAANGTSSGDCRPRIPARHRRRSTGPLGGAVPAAGRRGHHLRLSGPEPPLPPRAHPRRRGGFSEHHRSSRVASERCGSTGAAVRRQPDRAPRRHRPASGRAGAVRGRCDGTTVAGARRRRRRPAAGLRGRRPALPGSAGRSRRPTGGTLLQASSAWPRRLPGRRSADLREGSDRSSDGGTGIHSKRQKQRSCSKPSPTLASTPPPSGCARKPSPLTCTTRPGQGCWLNAAISPSTMANRTGSTASAWKHSTSPAARRRPRARRCAACQARSLPWAQQAAQRDCCWQQRCSARPTNRAIRAPRCGASSGALDALIESGRLAAAAEELPALKVAVDRVGGPVSAWHHDRVAACIAQARGRYAEAARSAGVDSSGCASSNRPRRPERHFALLIAMASHLGARDDSQKVSDPPPRFAMMAQPLPRLPADLHRPQPRGGSVVPAGGSHRDLVTARLLRPARLCVRRACLRGHRPVRRPRGTPAATRTLPR